MKKNILIITPFMPYPLNSGGNVAQFTINDELRKSFNLHLCFPLEKENNDYNILKEKWTDVSFYPFIESFRYKLARFLLQRIPVLFYDFIVSFLLKRKGISTKDFLIYKTASLYKFTNIYIDNTFINHLNSIIEKNKIDIIQVEFFDLINLAPFLPKDTFKIFIHHEIRYIRDRRTFDLMNHSFPYLEYLLLRNKGIELSLLGGFDKVVTLSSIDKKELESCASFLKIDVSPVPIKNQVSINNNSFFKFGYTITFLGGETHFPNKDAVDWFIENCWDRLINRFPNLTLNIIGSWSDETIAKYNVEKTIKFKGFVDDLSKELANTIFIVPIRIGSGIRMKIIEAINIGCPIISTTVGMEGLDFIDNRDFLLANSSEDFFLNLCKLIEDDKFSQALVKRSQQSLSEKYSFTNMIEMRKKVYDL